MSPASLAASTLVDAENSIRCFRAWFGDVPYGRIAITQQPEFNFGQSWPSLVYLPLFAFLDSTQRYMILGANTFKFTEFIDEVTPHEIAHQWWGHLVGWNSYHDQWLSEGFADFSASLFLEMTEKDRGKYLKYWEHHRKAILEKTRFGYAPNEAGPIWMGIRLDTFKTARAYASLVYPKGAFVLHMLRYLMQDSKTGDADFIAMMHDFTAKYGGKNASSADFQAVVEQHMKPAMDLDGNKRMNYFFSQWVFGTQVPSYHLSYHLAPEPNGKFLFTARITQSGVNDSFRARVPIYLDFGMPGGPQRLGSVFISGNRASEEISVRLPQKPKKVMLNYNFDVLARDASSDEI
jgi:aminopeptidase N